MQSATRWVSTLAALGTGATSFEDAWRKTLSSILSAVIDFVYKMTIQAAILQTLKSAFGAFGGALGGGASVPGTAGQGRAFAGFPAEGGDGGSPFARMAGGGGVGSTLGRGLVPVEARGGGGDVSIVVQNMAPNTRATATERPNGLGGKEVTITIVETIKEAISRGQLDGVMGASYGVGRGGRIRFALPPGAASPGRAWYSAGRGPGSCGGPLSALLFPD